MKKIILSILAIASFGIANAQEAEVSAHGFKSGDKWVEGSFSIQSGDSQDSWSFNPKVGYMLNNKFGIGGFISFSGFKDDNEKRNAYGLGGFARYYFLGLGAKKNFQAYGEAGLGFGSVKTSPNTGGSSTDAAINANVDLGINYFFTEHWAATFELANILSYNNTNPESGDNSNDLKVEVNLFNNIFAQPKFGLLYRW
jgi:Outer membrane protein beta-barrel domain